MTNGGQVWCKKERKYRVRIEIRELGNREEEI